jgi:hypothetical protein
MRRREFVKEYQDIKNKPENYKKNLLEKKVCRRNPKEKLLLKLKWR